MEKDERCLCKRCIADMRQAGYRCIPMIKKDDISYREECFKCHNAGYWYLIKK